MSVALSAAVEEDDRASDGGGDEAFELGRGDMRRLMSELGGQVRQIARFGSTEQRDAATEVLEDAKRKLYEILARPASDPRE